MTKRAMQKATTEIDDLRLQRSRAVLLLLRQKKTSPEQIALEAGKNVGSVYKAIEGSIKAPEIIFFLENKLGKGFTEIWRKYPNHTAA